MKTDTTVNISFEVTVRGEKYKYEDRGTGEVNFDLPEDALEDIDVSSILKGLLKVAYRKYKEKQAAEEETE